MVAKFEHTPKGQKQPDTPLSEVEETAMDEPKSDRREELQRRLDPNSVTARTADIKAKLIAVLDQAEGYRVLAIRSRDRGDRESCEHIVELYVRIAEQLETMLDGDETP